MLTALQDELSATSTDVNKCAWSDAPAKLRALSRVSSAAITASEVMAIKTTPRLRGKTEMALGGVNDGVAKLADKSVLGDKAASESEAPGVLNREGSSDEDDRGERGI